MNFPQPPTGASNPAQSVSRCVTGLPIVRVMAAQKKTQDTAGASTRFGWCHWHQGPSGTAVLIQVIEQGSGPGYALYACAPCREQRGLVAFDAAS
jgi:hypothetical protein